MRDEFFRKVPSLRDEFNHFYPSLGDFYTLYYQMSSCQTSQKRKFGTNSTYSFRSLANSQTTIPAVTLTFRECLVPNWGISRQPSLISTMFCLTPFTSLPKSRRSLWRGKGEPQAGSGAWWSLLPARCYIQSSLSASTSLPPLR